MVYLEVDILISVHQLWRIEPDVSVLNVEDDLTVIYRSDVIPVSSLNGIVNTAPRRINRLSNYRLNAFSYQVHLA